MTDKIDLHTHVSCNGVVFDISDGFDGLMINISGLRTIGNVNGQFVDHPDTVRFFTSSEQLKEIGQMFIEASQGNCNQKHKHPIMLSNKEKTNVK